MSRRRILLLVICFLTAAAGLSMLRSGGQDGVTRYTTSTHSAGPVGNKALYLTLEKLDLPVKRFRYPFRRLDQHQGILVITGPGPTGFLDRETKTLENWVKKGNRVLLCDGTIKTAATYTSNKTDSKKARTLTSTKLHSPSQKFQLSLKQGAAQLRTELAAQLPGIDFPFWVSVSDADRWQKLPSGWSTLLSDSAGPILVRKTLGKGSITALSDPTFASNENIRQDENLRFILAVLLEFGKPHEILFDEFHQGHARESSLWDYFGSSIAAWMVFQAFVGLGLFFFSQRARYAGKYRSLAEPKGRSSLEYVDSMATVYESCNASSTALEDMFGRFLGQLSRRVGIPIKKLRQASPQQIAVWAGDREGTLTRAVRECRQVTESAGNAEQALAAARRLAEASHAFGKTRKF